MSAVQMLKTNGTTSTTQVSTSQNINADHQRSQEASHFEDKLIQVAEMHGELMEFNGHLQRQLHSVEVLADRMRCELIHLRGPLPSDYVDQQHNVNGQDVHNSPNEAMTLVHLWIPSAFLVHGAADSHHIYQVLIIIIYFK